MRKTTTAVVMILLLLVGALGGYFISEWLDNRSSNVGRIGDSISYSPGDPFITNLKGSKQLLKTEIVIETDSKTVQAYLEKNNYKIRNLIIDNLSGLAAEDLARNDIRDTLKNQIRESLEKELSVNGIIGIYFNEFITQ